MTGEYSKRLCLSLVLLELPRVPFLSGKEGDVRAFESASHAGPGMNVSRKPI
jgi:hypothetical protein